MAKRRYAVVYTDENWIDSGFKDTADEAIHEWETITGSKYDESDSHVVQGFTEKEIADIEAYSDANPQ